MASTYIPATVQKARRDSELQDALLARMVQQPMRHTGPGTAIAQIAASYFLKNRADKASTALEQAEGKAAADRTAALSRAFGGGDPVVDAMAGRQG
ncbi:hypothetical protein, partial [Geminicoccus harenae]